GIHLLDRDVEPEPAAAGLVRPHTLHFRHARSFELIPDRAAAIGAAIEGVVVGRDARDGAEQYRAIAVHEAFDTNGRLLLETAGVVAGPFAERPFINAMVGRDVTLERDLGICWNRQPGDRAVDDLDRLAEQPAGGIVFVLAVGDLKASDH